MGGAPASAPGPAASWALERPARLALRSLEAGVLGDASEIVSAPPEVAAGDGRRAADIGPSVLDDAARLS